MITILVCFIRKKSKIVQGFAYTRFPRHHHRPPGELKAPPIPPTSIVFGFSKNRCAYIFYVLSPGKCLIDATNVVSRLH